MKKHSHQKHAWLVGLLLVVFLAVAGYIGGSLYRQSQFSRALPMAHRAASVQMEELEAAA